MEETLRVLVSIGFGLLLIMLRLDAERFVVAEYFDEAVGGRFAILRRRLAWYGIGLALMAAVVLVHPDAESRLDLRFGDGGQAVLAGLGYAALGAAQAAAVALLRLRRLRLPTLASRPWGLVNAAATAVIDEAAFRGIILGFLLQAGLDPWVAIVIGALVYALATRTGASGRDLYLLVLSLAVGLVGGWLTVEIGGIGAAIIGHSVTRCAVVALLGQGGAELTTAGTATPDERRTAPPGRRVVGAGESSAGER